MKMLRMLMICFNNTKTFSEIFINIICHLSGISCESCEFELLSLFQDLQNADHPRILEILCSLLGFSVDLPGFGE